MEKSNVIVTFDTNFISPFGNRLRPSYIYEQFISSSNFKLKNGVTGSVFLSLTAGRNGVHSHEPKSLEPDFHEFES